MKRCYACSVNPAREARSQEHVIPNALGGRWKTRLLCKECNQLFGHTIDAQLDKEFRIWMNLLSLSREYGDVQPVDVFAEGHGKLKLAADGFLRPQHPTVDEEHVGNQVNISIQARSKEEVLKIAQQIMRKSKRKYGDKVGTLMPITETVEDVKPEFGVRSVGSSSETFRAVAKIAVNAYLAWGGDQDNVNDTVAYIRGDTKAELTRWYFDIDPVRHRKQYSVTHVIAVRGDPDIGALWAYVELFRAFRFAVQLCRSYDGEQFEKDYAYDLFAASETPALIAFNPRELDPEVVGLDTETVKIAKAEIAHLLAMVKRRSMEQKVSKQ